MSEWKTLAEAARDASGDPAGFRRLARRVRRVLQGEPPPPDTRPVRVAVMGNSTLDILAPQLELALMARGLAPQVTVAPYGSFMQELIDPNSATAAFAPQAVLVVLTPRDVPEWPAASATVDEATACAGRVVGQLLSACEQFHRRSGAEVLINNFHILPTRPNGNAGARVPGDPNNFIQRVNVMLGDQAPAGVQVVDVAALAAQHGIRQWLDSRLWYESKQPVSPELCVEYVRTVSGVIAALLGGSRKCVVLDLDDTLWGGVIGDAGVSGIELGEGNARGEAFKAFQRYLVSLRERGILLAVCSKNEPANARLPFEQHPETVLTLGDFAAFRASWDPKADAIRAIAEDIGIGLDALVFVDDNPAERELIRQALPDVAVIDLPDDPSDYPTALESSRWLEVSRITDDDRARARQYQSRAEAQALSGTMDLSEFLASLSMTAKVAPITEDSIGRTTQLINKTNQFNVTTRRLTEGAVRSLMEDPSVYTRTVRLADRFGDHGLIGVLVASHRDDAVEVDDWLMSCRVLKRGVERMLLADLADWARARGARLLRSRFVATGRNELVRRLFDELGFERVAEAEAETHYSVPLDRLELLPHHIAVDRGESH